MRSVPRLYRTLELPQGQSANDPFPDSLFSRPITFKTTVNSTGPAGNIFQFGTHIGLDRVADGNFNLTIAEGITINLVDASRDVWVIVFSIRPGDGQIRFWNERKLLASRQNVSYANDEWGETGLMLVANAELLEPLSVYAAQIPRHFDGSHVAETQPETDNLLLNATALHFMTGFPHPLLEG